jgi:lysophospholipid acyltransferase (LPLAT)-like uncharacterized protein
MNGGTSSGDTALTWLATGVLGLLGRSWRIERAEGYREREAELQSGLRCIIAVWHGRVLPIAYTHRDRGVAVLISRSRDGERIARVTERMGFVTVRGSSSRGGEQALREMIDIAGRRTVLGMVPDGPRGPARIAKPGIVYLASRTGLPVLPLSVSATPAWVARSWDRMRIPRPFARVRLAYGAPLSVPRDLDERAEESWRARIEEALNRVTESLDESLGVTP